MGAEVASVARAVFSATRASSARSLSVDDSDGDGAGSCSSSSDASQDSGMVTSASYTGLLTESSPTCQSVSSLLSSGTSAQLLKAARYR